MDDRIIKLVQEAQRGSKQAFADLYEAYQQPLYYYAFKRLGSDDAARDIVQETFLSLMLKIDGLQNPASFNSWIYRIASNFTTMCLRRRQREVQMSFDQDSEGLEGSDFAASLTEDFAVELAAKEFLPESALETAENRDMLLQLINNLTDTRKEVIILSYYAGFSSQEIADILNVKVGVIDKRLHDARRVLQAGLIKASDQPVMIPAKRAAVEASRPKKAMAAASASVDQAPVLTRLLREEGASSKSAKIREQISMGLAAAVPGLLASGEVSASVQARAAYFLETAHLIMTSAAKAAPGGGMGQVLPEAISSGRAAAPKATFLSTVATHSGPLALAAAVLVAAITGGALAIWRPNAAALSQQPPQVDIAYITPSPRETPPPVPQPLSTPATPTPTPTTEVAATDDSVGRAVPGAPSEPTQPQPTAPATPAAPPRPTITVAHPTLTYPLGTTPSASQVIGDAGITAKDNTGAQLPVIVVGLERITPTAKGAVLIFVCTKDAAGTAAKTKVLTIQIE